MARPDVPGAPTTDYEEVWRYLPATSGAQRSGPPVAWIIESDDGEQPIGRRQVTKTFLGRIGDRYLALQQEQTHVRSQSGNGDWQTKIYGGEVSACSEVWCGDRWEQKYALGSSRYQLPSMSRDFDAEKQATWREVGGKVFVGTRRYIVRAFEEGETSLRGRL